MTGCCDDFPLDTINQCYFDRFAPQQHSIRVNVPIVVQFVVVPMCFNGFKVSERHFLNIAIVICFIFAITTIFTMKYIKFSKNYKFL